MNKSYAIQWRSTVNGRAGKGTKTFDLEEAESLAAELNGEYPEIHHEVVEASPPPEPASLDLDSEDAGSETPQTEDSPDHVLSFH